MWSAFRWSDRSRNTRLVVLVSNVPQIVGSFMYFIGLSPWMLVAGRFVAGKNTSFAVLLLWLFITVIFLYGHSNDGIH